MAVAWGRVAWDGVMRIILNSFFSPLFLTLQRQQYPCDLNIPEKGEHYLMSGTANQIASWSPPTARVSGQSEYAALGTFLPKCPLLAGIYWERDAEAFGRTS